MTQTAIALIGPGLVGKALLSQLETHNASHESKVSASNCSTRLPVIAIINSKKMLTSSDIQQGITKPTQWISSPEYSSSLQQAILDKFIQHLVDLKQRYESLKIVVVDCTSSDYFASQYPNWLRKNLSIVTPNKKAFSSDEALWREIMELSNFANGGDDKPMVGFESTVGAGLPVIKTLKDLIETGDKIHSIEGIFSGTLSYLFNTFSTLSDSQPKQSFSQVVKIAKELGYTEPDPRDDLNGVDVARKVIILGRVSTYFAASVPKNSLTEKLPLSLSTLPIENIVPEELRAIESSEEFMLKLPSFDAHFNALNTSAKSQNTVLRYTGAINLLKNTAEVKLQAYESSHPFANLSGSDNLIRFVTERFPNGIVVQGAGAGDAVTAFGCFADILRIARSC